MKLSTGNGLELYVNAAHIVAITNYRIEASEVVMKNMSQIHLLNGQRFLVEGSAFAVDKIKQQELDNVK